MDLNPAVTFRGIQNFYLIVNKLWLEDPVSSGYRYVMDRFKHWLMGHEDNFGLMFSHDIGVGATNAVCHRSMQIEVAVKWN
jgi:hypothetical protein